MSDTWAKWAEGALKLDQLKAADHAGIYGQDGNCWGATDAFAKNVPKDFFVEAEKLMSGGPAAGKLVLSDKRYITLKTDPTSVTAKCGTAGVSICKTKQGFIVSFYDGEDVQGNNNFCAASNICEKLKDVGY